MPEADNSTPRCTSQNRDGKPCGVAAMLNTSPPRCHAHNPALEAERIADKAESGRLRTHYSEANKRLVQNAATAPLVLNDLSTPEGVGLELERVIRALSSGSMPSRIADTLIRALMARLKCHDLEISERLEAMERDAKTRAADPTQPGGIVRRQGKGR